MKNLARHGPILLLVLLTAAPVTFSQASTSAPKSAPRVLIFTFRDPADEYSTWVGDDGRFYIQVVTSNIPSYRFEPADPASKVMVDNERSNQDVMVYWVAVRPQTSPRVDKKKLTLVVTYSPPDETLASVASAPSMLPPSASTNGTELPKISHPDLGARNTAQPNLSDDGSVSVGPTITPPAQAPPSAFDMAKAPVDSANIDLSVPDSPAFTVLGLNPQTVTRPASPREFASSLLNGVDKNGNFQSGVALDFAPYQILAGDRLTLSDYNSKLGLRWLARTQLSFATAKGVSENDKALRLALGFHLALWDKGDPHSDARLMKCFEDNLRFAQRPKILPPDQLPPGASEDLKKRAQEEWDRFTKENDALADPNNENAEKCRALARKRNWNKSAWIIGAAPSWISTTGQTKDFRWNGGGLWSSVSYGFEGVPALEDKAQFIFHLRYRNNEEVPDPNINGEFLNQNSFFVGSTFRAGNQNASASFEGLYLRSRFKGQNVDTSSRFALSLERKLAENLWFTLSFGGNHGRADNRNNGFVLGSFKWGFSDKKSPVAKQ